MGVALRAASPAADRLYRLADEKTGLPIGDLCRAGPLEELTRTLVAQTAVVVTSLAAAACLEERLGGRPEAIAVAGHSVGELAAMCWAGVFDYAEAIELVHHRATLMERDSAACDGTMVAVLGLSPERIEEVCAQASASGQGGVEIANLNAPGQVVLSGERTAVKVAGDLATAAGARRVIPLAVSGPFHSHYMAAAARDYASLVARTHLQEPRGPVVLNTSAAPTSDVELLRADLFAQITRPVRWEESLRTLAGLGCDTFVELGPGQVLTGLVRRTLPDARAVAAGTPDAISAAAELIAGRVRT